MNTNYDKRGGAKYNSKERRVLSLNVSGLNDYNMGKTEVDFHLSCVVVFVYSWCYKQNTINWMVKKRNIFLIVLEVEEFKIKEVTCKDELRGQYKQIFTQVKYADLVLWWL